MFGVVKPLNDQRRMPESPDQANNCGSLPETQGFEFPLQKTSPAHIRTKASESAHRYSCYKTLQQSQDHRPDKSVRLNLNAELRGLEQQVPEVVLLVRGERHPGEEQGDSEGREGDHER